MRRDPLRSSIAFRLDCLFSRAHGGWGPRDIASDFASLVAAFADGRVQFRLIHLPLDACAAGLRDVPEPRGNESDRHARMKRAAQLWMRQEGAADATMEKRCFAGRADVFSATACWLVECGNTPIAKLNACIERDKPSRFTLIPYQQTHRTDGSPRRLIAVDFAWDPSLSREIEDAAFLRAKAAFAHLELDPPPPSAAYRAAMKFCGSSLPAMEVAR